MRDKWKLLPEKLRKVKRTDSWKLEDTDDISAPGAGTAGLIGQERAIESMEFGLSVPGRGYNVFVLGRPGSGRTSYALDSLRKRAAANRRRRIRNKTMPSRVSIKRWYPAS